MKARVLIEVLGGVAEVAVVTGDVEVIIIDYDNIKAGDKLDLSPDASVATTELGFQAILDRIVRQWTPK